MICECVQVAGKPHPLCTDCGGTGWSHCCEGERPGNTPRTPVHPAMEETMRIEGESAASWTAIRLDSFQSVEGKGKLKLADTATGEVEWTDHTGTACKLNLGPHAIRLVERRA